jgi:hypothetical protein
VSTGNEPVIYEARSDWGAPTAKFNISDILQVLPNQALSITISLTLSAWAVAQGLTSSSASGWVDPQLFLDPILLDAGFTLEWSSNVGNSAVPLPAALPLFAAGLGLLGLLGWRKNRKHGVEA